MNDITFLIIALGLIYLSDCCWWIRGGSLVVAWQSPGRYRIAYPLAWAGNTDAGFIFLNPLPFVGEAYACSAWPLSLTQTQACSYTALTTAPQGRHQRSPVCASWGGCQTLAVAGRSIWLNGAVFASFSDEPSAHHYARILERVGAADPAMRDAAIRGIVQESLCVEAIHERLTACRRLCTPLRVCGGILFACVSGGLPAVLCVPGCRPYLTELLLLALSLILVIAYRFNGAYRLLFPDDNGARRLATLSLMLMPTAAMRAHYTLGRHLLHAYHPLAVAAALGDLATFRSLARQVLLDMHCPMRPEWPREDVQLQNTEMAFRTRTSRALRALPAKRQHHGESRLQIPDERRVFLLRVLMADYDYLCDFVADGRIAGRGSFGRRLNKQIVTKQRNCTGAAQPPQSRAVLSHHRFRHPPSGSK